MHHGGALWSTKRAMHVVVHKAILCYGAQDALTHLLDHKDPSVSAKKRPDGLTLPNVLLVSPCFVADKKIKRRGA